ncbi:MAG TPA: hypothetical protein VJ742_12060 [Nitrososphaera sp.]|nr:hypothetical protein [Nitrososphaera sp.]
MSQNKRKYFEVTTSSIVSANNKADAVLAVQRKRGVDASVLSTDTWAERISATEAQSFSAEA